MISLPAELGGHISRNLGAVRVARDNPKVSIPACGRRLIGVDAGSGAVTEHCANSLHRLQDLLGQGRRLKDM
jgi:hypothetical protein